MKNFVFPNPKNITTTIDSDLSEFDLSYSESIKEFISDEMNIDFNLLKNLKCAFFTNYKKINNSDIAIGPLSSILPIGVLRPSENLLLISIDANLEGKLSTIVHEAGHFLSLKYISVSIAEACALRYERKWFEENNIIDEFNRKYNEHFIEEYYYSLKLLDMISSSVFNNKNEEFEKYIKHGFDNEFNNKIEDYLISKRCVLSSLELFFLIDVLLYNRNDKYLSRAFEEKPPYFYRIFNELHNDILPVIFDIKSTREDICIVNNKLVKYKDNIELIFQFLEQIRNNYSYEKYNAFKILYKKNLAKEFKELDKLDYFGEISGEELKSAIKDNIIIAFNETYNRLIEYNSSKNKTI